MGIESVNNMNIEAVEVLRDDCGMWDHPKLPKWEEYTTKAEMDAWAKDNNGFFDMDHFEHTASEKMQKEWFKDGENNCTDWVPVCNSIGAFLLSIFDTEDGPIALYFVPKEIAA